ncbi:MAG: DUF6798 domain-containing protein [Granulicella sp.]
MRTTAIIQHIKSSRLPGTLCERSLPFAVITLLTACALAIHGYHPYAEDGGLYATGIKFLLNPALYPHSLPFVEAHLRFSLFAPAVAATVRFTHLSLATVLFAIYLISIWTTLYGIWLLSERCYSSRVAHAGAVLLVAAWLTVPIAGTSLMLMDPYVTARSVSLPCTLFALAATLDLRIPGRCVRSLILCAIMLLVAAAAHPLMAAYGLGNVLLLLTILSPSPSVRRWGIVGLCTSAFAVAALVQATAPPDSAGYVRIAITRYYWFLSQWQWYELIGIIAPLLILIIATLVVSRRRDLNSPVHQSRQALTAMAVVTGTTAVLIALAFAHESYASHLVARLQPLRSFQTIYLLMILVLGAALGEHLLRRKPWRWIAALIFFGSIFFLVQQSTYPSSAHIEWPDVNPQNRWEKAFLWISRNTPVDALFALDPHYISLPGEDAQNFRALAERSALADYSKDGGEASITPALTYAWAEGQRLQNRLSLESDTERLKALKPAGVDWIILQLQAQTTFDCPYRNDLVKVCRLP